MKSALAALLLLAPAAAYAQPADPYDQAVAARMAGNHQEALRLLEPLSREQPDNADVWLLLGLTYTALGRLDAADAALARAHALAPDYQDVIDARARLGGMARDDSPLARARAARLAGHHEEARRILEPLVREQPDNADAWLTLGLTYTALGRLDDADAALARAHEISPDYQDVNEARARLAKMRQGGPAKWRLDATAGYSRLSDGLEPWRFASAYLTRRFDKSWLTVGAEHSDRFGASDLYLDVRGAHDFGGWDGYLELGGTPDADHRPEWTVRTGAMAAPADEGWSWRPGIDAVWARYAAGDVRALQPGLTVQNRTVSLRARWIATWDEFDDFRAGYGLDGWWQASDRWRLLTSWTDAAESSEGVTVDVKAVGLGVAVDVSDAVSLRLDAVHETRDAYDSDGVSAGVTRRF
ncbi:MAG TPA: YaiO family outer membrane beta-barrel protein [Caulobacteraceae bacterium]